VDEEPSLNPNDIPDIAANPLPDAAAASEASHQDLLPLGYGQKQYL
jgi:hypothetical protein